MNEREFATVEIFRFDPQVDKEPRYQEFKVPYKGRTVLDVLREIYEKHDSTLAFRYACVGGYCRSCVIVVNGNPAMACVKMAEPKMKIDPHKKFEVLKDLLVDLSKPKW